MMTLDPRIGKPLYWCDGCGQDAAYGMSGGHWCGPYGCRTEALVVVDATSPKAEVRMPKLTLAEELALEERADPSPRKPPAPKRRSPPAAPKPTTQGSLF